MVSKTYTLAALCIANTLTACVDIEPSVRPFTVEVLAFTGNDPATGAGTYALRPVELPALLSVDPMYDSIFRFVEQPNIDLDALSKLADLDQVLASVRSAATYVPRLRDLDGTLVPRDLMSLQTVSAYAAFRTAADAIPEVTGLPRSAIIPASGLQVWVKPVFTQGAATSRMETNAFYLPYTDSFGLLDSSSLERRPIGALGPVVTHEFGHHLFHRSFTQADGVCDEDAPGGNYPGRFASDRGIAGINEGFADWTAFVIAGATNSLINAFEPEVGNPGERAIDVRFAYATKFTYQTLARCTGDYYCVGTLFARSLFEAFLARGGEPSDRQQRMAASRNVFAAMVAAPLHMRERTWPRPNKACAAELSTAVDDEVVSGFLGAFVAGLPASDRASVCERFIANFGDAGFKAEFRGACL